MNDKMKSELPDLIRDSANEILTKQREAARARIKPVLEYKEAMDKSIADCERDLEKARKVRDEFAAKILQAQGGAEGNQGDYTALEDAEKIMSEADAVYYQPAVARQALATGYVTSSYTTGPAYIQIR